METNTLGNGIIIQGHVIIIPQIFMQRVTDPLHPASHLPVIRKGQSKP